MQQRMLDVLEDSDVKGDLQKAKLKAGYARGTRLSQIVNEDMEREIVRRSHAWMAAHAIKTVMTATDLLDNPMNPDTAMLLRIAESLMDRQGLAKKQNVEVEHKLPNAVVKIPGKVMLDELPANEMIDAQATLCSPEANL